MTGNNVTLGIQIIPKSKNIDAYVLIDTAIEAIKIEGVKHIITPFETVMEGDYDELMEVCKIAQQAVLDAGAEECLVYYRIQYRKSGDVGFEEKRLHR